MLLAFFSAKGALLAGDQLAVHQDSQSCFPAPNMDSSESNSPACPCPSEWQHNHPVYQLLPSFVLSVNLLGVHSVPAFMLLMKVLNNIGPRKSQNHIGWKRPLRSSSPTINLILPKPPLHHVHKHLIQTSFKYLQGWRLNHFPGQPVPMLDNPLGEEKFPNIQSKPPLAQLEAISSYPITCYLGEETDPHLSTTSFQVVEESDKVSPQPPFLQAKQSQLPQPLLIRLLLQTLHQLRCPSLHTLQYLNIPLVVGGPKLNTVFEERPHQCRVQGHNHFPSPAGHAIFDTSQDAIGFLGRLGTLLAHIQAAVNQHPQVLLCQAAFQPLFPKPVALHGVAVAQVQDLALGLVKPHTIDLGPSIQPVQVPLQSLPTLQQINTPTQLGVICKLTEGALDPFVQIIDKDVKQNWPQHRALGNTACDRPPTGVNSIHHHSLGPAVQPVLYPAKNSLPYPTGGEVLPNIWSTDGEFTIPEQKQVENNEELASSYERKLIEVAEMHGELIEFNERLHRALMAKEALVSQMRQELIDLRGPVPGDLSQTSEDQSLSDFEISNRALINVWIPSVFLRGKAANAFHVYQPVPMLDNPFNEVKFPNIQSKPPPLAQLEAISSCPMPCYLGEETDPHLATTSFQVYIRIKDDEWNVYRRYAEFRSLHHKLQNKYQQRYRLSMTPYGVGYPFGQLGSAVLAVSPPSFLCPPNLLAGGDAKFVEERRKQLQNYLRNQFVLLREICQQCPIDIPPSGEPVSKSNRSRVTTRFPKLSRSHQREPRSLEPQS
ncbi:hypothetical protein QYF61_004748, partial [Mycteria americana]